MSSDDILIIIKVGNKFFGYRVMLSVAPEGGFTMDDIIEKGHFQFEAVSLEDAIIKAQSIETEYGYEFYNLRVSTGFPDDQSVTSKVKIDGM